MITHHVTTLASGAVPSVGAIACLAAVAVMCLLDRIPLSAYRPRQDDGHRPRRRCPPRAGVQSVQVEVEEFREEFQDEPPPTTVRRLDPPAIPARPTRRRELEGR